MTRPPQFKPDFGIEPPEDRPIVIPWWVLLAAFLALCALLGYLKGP